MSLYTTGELAKKCNVSVRTIQYYDERGILVPTDLTEGGRRLFSEKDVATLETICFLRDLDISIKDIAEILESDESKKGIVTFVIGILQEIWIPFFVTTAVYTICAVFLANYWYKRIEYICPECHTRFQPRKMETLLANHNPKMRKLTCPSCRRKIWSLEVYRKEVDA